MKISIITVCRNAENAIERTMLSVVTQSCFSENIEYVVIDGASTDKTVEIIQQYAAKYPIKWISEPDSGIYNAMNKGIKLAAGNYLLFLNAGDCLVHYNIIKSLMNLFKRDIFDIIRGNVFRVDPTTNKYEIVGSKNPDAYLFFIDGLPHQAIFYKKNLFYKFGNYNEFYKIIADNVFNKKILCDNKISDLYVDIVISLFFKDGISSTNIELYKNEKQIFLSQNFTEKEQAEIKRKEQIQLRKNQKSLLRFLAKVLIKMHEFWINR